MYLDHDDQFCLNKNPGRWNLLAACNKSTHRPVLEYHESGFFRNKYNRDLALAYNEKEACYTVTAAQGYSDFRNSFERKVQRHCTAELAQHLIDIAELARASSVSKCRRGKDGSWYDLTIAQGASAVGLTVWSPLPNSPAERLCSVFRDLAEDIAQNDYWQDEENPLRLRGEDYTGERFKPDIVRAKAGFAARQFLRPIETGPRSE